MIAYEKEVVFYQNGKYVGGHQVLNDIKMSKNNINHYYYICDNCGHLIETLINMK